MSTAAAQPGVTPEFAVAFRATLLQSLAQEMRTTSAVIQAVPDARSDYRPDPKSRSAAELAWHIALEDVLFLEQLIEGKFYLPDPRYDNERPTTSAGVAAWYERRFAAAMEKVRALPAEKLTQPLDFLGFITLPAVMYLLLTNNHSIHHRGQLSTYLRAMGAKVPSIYGPSADTMAA